MVSQHMMLYLRQHFLRATQRNNETFILSEA